MTGVRINLRLTGLVMKSETLNQNKTQIECDRAHTDPAPMELHSASSDEHLPFVIWDTRSTSVKRASVYSQAAQAARSALSNLPKGSGLD